jgi:predicted ATPase
VIAVLGEAGIGKSALLDAIALRATGLTVAAGCAAEHERDLPFALTSAALEPHVATVGQARTLALADRYGVAYTRSACSVPERTNAAERYRFHRVQRAFVELLGPSALLFDDVQWADDASLELLLHLLTRPPEVPHLLVFALRPATVAGPLLDAARRRPGFEELSLGPLDDAASRVLVGDREHLVRAAAGVPLYLTELARAVGDELPATLQAAVQREVDALDPAARALLRGAAIAGDPFDPELAAAAASDGSLRLSFSEPSLVPRSDVLDALVQADLVRPHPGARRFAFRHPLVRRAVYDATPPAWRLAAHERVASALEWRGAGAAARAYHVARFARAGDRAAVELLRRAGGDRLADLSRYGRELVRRRAAARPGGGAAGARRSAGAVARERGPAGREPRALPRGARARPRRPRADPRLCPRREPPRPLRPGPAPPARGV